jgi:hypothetical protein
MRGGAFGSSYTHASVNFVAVRVNERWQDDHNSFNCGIDPTISPAQDDCRIENNGDGRRAATPILQFSIW